MNSLYILNSIREFAKQISSAEFVNNNPPQIIIGAGDVKQLPPIKDLTNIPESPTNTPTTVSTKYLNMTCMMLKICKRLGTKDDRKARRTATP